MKIFKIGGNIINNDAALQAFLKTFSNITGPKILVHGGGRKATELAARMNVSTKMVDGRRVTDEKMLEIVTMVYAGLLNKKITASLNALSCNALGLSGADLNIIQAHKRIIKTIDYGFAGDIDLVDAKKIKQIMELSIVPVFCAITHDNNHQLLNTNADTIANELAKALSKFYEVSLYMVFEKDGVLRDPKDDSSFIEKINEQNYSQLLNEKIISGGMIPKIDNAFDAIKNGVTMVKIGSSKMLDNNKIGTVIAK